MAPLQAYLDQGWELQAVKLVSADESPFATLPNLHLAFDTAEPVYPLRLSGKATVSQKVRLYVIANEPVSYTHLTLPTTPYV